MWLIAPVALLVLTLLALAASNLQRGFRSNWLLVLGGVSLAWLSLLILRLQLPQTATFPAWWAGEGLEYSANFALDDRSWPLALMLCSILAAALLGQARDAASAGWVTWAPVLIAGAAALFATLSADALTFVFTWALLDVLVCSLLLTQVANAAERHAALRLLPLSLLGLGLLTAAWMLSFYGALLAAILVFLAATARLGLWTPQLVLQTRLTLRADVAAMLRLAPLAAALALLVQNQAITTNLPHSLALVCLFIPAVFLASRWYSDGDESMALELGFAALAAAASISGDGAAALAYALIALAARAILRLAQHAGRFRLPAAIVGGLLLAGLPLTASQAVGNFYGDPASPLGYIFILAHGWLLAGWIRHARQPAGLPESPEPWMRSLNWVGLAVVPVVYVLLGLGLLPVFESARPAALWPPIAVIALAAIIAIAFNKRRADMPARAREIIRIFFSFEWLSYLAAVLARAISWLLYAMARVLEGHAGLLWAILVAAVLLSLLAQVGLG